MEATRHLEFPSHLRRDRPSDTATALIANAKRLLKDGIMTPEDRQFAAWARAAVPSDAECLCGERSYSSHVVAARIGVNALLHDPQVSSRLRVYACRLDRHVLHVGRDR